MIALRGIILSFAAGTFLYLATMHEMEHNPLVRDCGTLHGFGLMIAGFAVTAAARFLMGEAHRL